MSRALLSLPLQRREFCFTLENEVFVRYQSFKDSAELRTALMKKYAYAFCVNKAFSRCAFCQVPCEDRYWPSFQCRPAETFRLLSAGF